MSLHSANKVQWRYCCLLGAPARAIFLPLGTFSFLPPCLWLLCRCNGQDWNPLRNKVTASHESRHRRKLGLVEQSHLTTHDCQLLDKRPGDLHCALDTLVWMIIPQRQTYSTKPVGLVVRGKLKIAVEISSISGLSLVSRPLSTLLYPGLAARADFFSQIPFSSSYTSSGKPEASAEEWGWADKLNTCFAVIGTTPSEFCSSSHGWVLACLWCSCGWRDALWLDCHNQDHTLLSLPFISPS